MTSTSQAVEQFVSDEYQHGFVTPIESDTLLLKEWHPTRNGSKRGFVELAKDHDPTGDENRNIDNGMAQPTRPHRAVLEIEPAPDQASHEATR